MAGAHFLDAQMCPWTQSLHTSSLSSTPGTRGFQIENNNCLKKKDEEEERKKGNVKVLAISTFSLVDSDPNRYENWSILFENTFPFNEF